jgi:hypothetical protein
LLKNLHYLAVTTPEPVMAFNAGLSAVVWRQFVLPGFMYWKLALGDGIRRWHL